MKAIFTLIKHRQPAPDANVCIAYIVDIKIGSIHIKLLQTQSMQKYLDSELRLGRVVITETVEGETLSSVWDELSRMKQQADLSKNLHVAILVNQSATAFGKLTVNGICPDDVSMLPEVSNMYRDIWSKPQKRPQIQTWAAKKRLRPKDGPPAGSDLIILSTAAQLAKTKTVDLLTFDHDFTVFTDDIRKTLNVNVVDASLIRV